MTRTLWGRDQLGNTWGPLNPRGPKVALLDKTGRNSAQRMFRDFKDGRTVHAGYVVHAPRGSHEYPLWVSLEWREPFEGKA